MSQSISHQLQVLFATFPPQAGELQAQLEAYSIALEAHDERDISAAIRRFIRGEVEGHNQSFAPTAAKLGAVVRLCMNDRLDSEHRSKMPELPAPVIEHTPEERAKVSALVADFVERHRVAGVESDGAFFRSTNKMFEPDMSPAAVKHRLGFAVGDPEGDTDAA